MRTRMLLAVLALVAAGCGGPGAFAGSATPSPGVASTTSSWAFLGTAADCAAPIIVPTVPAVIPGEAEIDPDTGLHVTGDPVEVDLSTWRLEVTGRVDRPLSLTYDELRCLPKVAASPVLDCPGFFQDEAAWSGVPLRDVLELAGIQEGATQARLLAADGYNLWVELTPETLGSAFLAYELEGETLPVLHGFPVRFVWPGHEGWNWVKWLVAIEVI
jgi:DMSO/TMAO reductase YedYZ molybdopterin-dependent catalytic subunit